MAPMRKQEVELAILPDSAYDFLCLKKLKTITEKVNKIITCGCEHLVTYEKVQIDNTPHKDSEMLNPYQYYVWDMIHASCCLDGNHYDYQLDITSL